MKYLHKIPMLKTISFLLLCTFISCGESNEQPTEISETEEHHEAVEEAMLSQERFDALGMKIGTLSKQSLTGFVEANGQLEVPPQNQATVTTSVGANIDEILVIEGDKVQKGEVVAYISHPDLVQLQTDFLKAANRAALLKNEFERQKKLYEAGVASGMEFQQAESNYQVAKGLVTGLKTQLGMLGVNPQQILSGNIYKRFPLVSPIDGAVQKVGVVTGQFVEPRTNLFEIVNTEHVHVDLMVFEKDVHQLAAGQKVYFEVSALPGNQMTAEIISIGKTFEQGPKAVHVHAEIKNKTKNLIPGMYVEARIATDSTMTIALPKEAVVKEGGKSFAFTAEREGEAWSFQPVEVITGQKDEKWVAVEFKEKPAPNIKFAFNNAYYLMAEMKKGEGGGHHH